MEIKILKELEINNRFGRFTNQGISMERIEALEQLYNNGNPFPRVLREMLYLGGDDCIVLDYAGEDTAEEFQIRVREELTRYGMTISRPFFCVDSTASFAASAFTFMYTDDSNENPPLWNAYMDEKSVEEFPESSLSLLIHDRLERIRRGSGPF